jgi:flagellar motility protein MotE (MotC chaperone)
MKFLGNIRILPVVLAAIICLVGLKIMGLVLNGGYIFADRDTAPKKPSWAQEMFNFPSGSSSKYAAGDPSDITGSVDEKKDEKKEGAKDGAKDAKKDEGKGEKKPEGKDAAAAPADGKPPEQANIPDHAVSASERAILERLQERRQEIEARAREIDIRENLLKAAEKRIEGKVEEMKAVEARIGTANDQKSQADAARFKGIVTMYESMKPKDAAKIFDRLDMSVLIEVAMQIAPRKMSDIMGQMQAETAERLTVEMARRAGGDKTATAMDLPKIEGRPAADGAN